jgi:hypothetical protein
MIVQLPYYLKTPYNIFVKTNFHGNRIRNLKFLISSDIRRRNLRTVHLMQSVHISSFLPLERERERERERQREKDKKEKSRQKKKSEARV